MDDSFTLGKPSRRKAITKTSSPKASRSSASVGMPGVGRPGVGRIVVLVIVGIVAVLAIAGYLTFLRSSGEQIASDERTAISQIGAAGDVDARSTAQQAAVAVQELYAEQGSFSAITPAALKHVEPTYTYTDSASTGPNVVSVSSSASGAGLAVLSASGTCFTTHVAANGTTTGQSPGACTGASALSTSSS